MRFFSFLLCSLLSPFNIIHVHISNFLRQWFWMRQRRKYLRIPRLTALSLQVMNNCSDRCDFPPFYYCNNQRNSDMQNAIMLLKKHALNILHAINLCHSQFLFNKPILCKEVLQYFEHIFQQEVSSNAELNTKSICKYCRASYEILTIPLEPTFCHFLVGPNGLVVNIFIEFPFNYKMCSISITDLFHCLFLPTTT